MIHPDVTGVVLAGGKSQRMGRNKALMEYQGEPLVLRAVQILRQVTGKVIISSDRHNYERFGLEVWPDELPDRTAMTGIYTCLKRSLERWIMVLSCDMPLMDPRLFEILYINSSNYDVIVPVHDQEAVEPLCGMYHQRALKMLEELLKSHQYGLQQFILRSNHKLVTINQDMFWYHPKLFTNINTPEDFNKLP